MAGWPSPSETHAGARTGLEIGCENGDKLRVAFALDGLRSYTSPEASALRLIAAA